MTSIPSPSELIKGTDIVSTFQNLYNLGFAILLALAFLSFVFGAFQYLLSGASIFNQQEGKNRMKNSLIVLIVILIFPPILNLINPGIFQGAEMQIPRITIWPPEKILYDPNVPGTFPGAKTNYNIDDIRDYMAKKNKKIQCKIPKTGPCLPKTIKGVIDARFKTQLRQNVDYEALAKKLSVICLNESQGIATLPSKSDKCRKSAEVESKKRFNEGKAFSIGLFQINMTRRNFSYVHKGKKFKCIAKEIFSGTDYECVIINEQLYNQCSKILMNPFFNTYLAFQISDHGDNLDAWSVWPLIEKNCPADLFK